MRTLCVHTCLMSLIAQFLLPSSIQRIHVYKRAIQALIYPASGREKPLLWQHTHTCTCTGLSRLGVDVDFFSAFSSSSSSYFSDPDMHQFVDTTFKKPTYCTECDGFIWGLNKQGVKCQRKQICTDRQTDRLTHTLLLLCRMWQGLSQTMPNFGQSRLFCQYVVVSHDLSCDNINCHVIIISFLAPPSVHESNSSFADAHLVAVNDKMQRMITSHPARFDLLR